VLGRLAADLVQLKVDVIVASGAQAPLAAKHATRTIPSAIRARDFTRSGTSPS